MTQPNYSDGGWARPNKFVWTEEDKLQHTEALYRLEIIDKSDLTKVKAHCTCGEFDFKGDWDDLCAQWFIHEGDPEYNFVYSTKLNHAAHSLMSREATKRLQELWPDKFGEHNG